MTDVQKAIQSLHDALGKFKPLLELADSLKKVGSIEDAEREAIARKEAALEAFAGADAQLKDKMRELGRANEAIEKAKEAKKEIEDEARRCASDIIGQGKAEQMKLVAEGQKMRAESEGYAKAKKEEAEVFRAEADSAKKYLESTKQQVERAKKIEQAMKG